MLGGDLAHLVEELAQGLAVVPQVALPGLDVEVVEVDLDLLAEGQCLDVGVVFVIEIEVETGKFGAQISEITRVVADASKRLGDGAF